MSSQCATGTDAGANASISGPNEMTAAAPATSAGVRRSGLRSPTSKPSPAKPATTSGGMASSGSVPADNARNREPCSAARRLKYSIAMKLFAEACRQTKRTVSLLVIGISPLFHKDPAGLKQRKGDEADESRRRHQRRIADFPAEQNADADKADERRQPGADGNPAEQDRGAEDRADRRGIGAFDEALDIGIGAMADEDGRDDENEKEGGQEDADGRDQRAPETGDQVADEGCGNDDRTGTDHADGNGDEKLPAVEPAGLLYQSLLEKRDDHQTAAESQRTCLQEEEQKLRQGRARGDRARRRACGDRRHRQRDLRRRRSAAEERAAGEQ